MCALINAYNKIRNQVYRNSRGNFEAKVSSSDFVVCFSQTANRILYVYILMSGLIILFSPSDRVQWGFEHGLRHVNQVRCSRLIPGRLRIIMVMLMWLFDQTLAYLVGILAGIITCRMESWIIRHYVFLVDASSTRIRAFQLLCGSVTREPSVNCGKLSRILYYSAILLLLPLLGIVLCCGRVRRRECRAKWSWVKESEWVCEHQNRYLMAPNANNRCQTNFD